MDKKQQTRAPNTLSSWNYRYCFNISLIRLFVTSLPNQFKATKTVFIVYSKIIFCKVNKFSYGQPSVHPTLYSTNQPTNQPATNQSINHPTKYSIPLWTQAPLSLDRIFLPLAPVEGMKNQKYPEIYRI